MSIVLQLALLATIGVGSGYWLWILAGRPSCRRKVMWVWFGLAGYAAHVLVLQALVYLDLPVRKTAVGLYALALAGVAVLGFRLWRHRRSVRLRRTETLIVVGAAALAVGIQSASVAAIGSERFVGAATIDHVNYVLTAQWLADAPYSTSVADIGLRPWLYQPVLAKHTRLTECVALADLAVLARTDAQRAWAASALGSIALLTLAVAGMLRTESTAPTFYIAVAAAWAAVLPAIATVFLAGFFSQLCTLWTFPALVGILRPAALPARARIVLAATTLAFLFATYTEFIPIGAAMAGVLILASPASWRQRLQTTAAVTAVTALLTGGYLFDGLSYLLSQMRDAVSPDLLTVWAKHAGTWRGWTETFFSDGHLAAVGAGLIAIGVVVAALAAARRNRGWSLALGVPAAAIVVLIARPRVPVYALYKLQCGLAPVFVAAAAAGLWALGRRARHTWAPATLLGIATVASAAATVGVHREVIDDALRIRAADFAQLWAARDRAAGQRGATFLISAPSSYTGAWLAYFARDAATYYEPDAVSDRRAPTSLLSFRNLPAGVPCTWLALDRAGPVENYEPSPHLAIVDSVRQENGLFALGPETHLTLHRAAGFTPAVRTWSLECGILPLPGAGPCRIECLQTGETEPQAVEVRGATWVQFKIHARAGPNALVVRATSHVPTENSAAPVILMQSVSLERCVE